MTSTVKLFLLCAFLTFLQTATLAQTNNQDPYLQEIEFKFQNLLSKRNKLEHKPFEFWYCSRYINEKGDTITEGECELRKITVYLEDGKVLSIFDRKEGGEGCSYYREQEYLFDNNELVYLLMRSDCISYNTEGNKGSTHDLRETRYYYKSNQLYRNTERAFMGYTVDLDAFLKGNNHITKAVDLTDDYYLKEGLALKNDFLTNNMNTYEEKIEKLKTDKFQALPCGLYMNDTGDIGFKTSCSADDLGNHTSCYSTWGYFMDGKDSINADIVELKNIVDVPSFQILNEYYCKDKNYVYAIFYTSSGATLNITRKIDIKSFSALGTSSYAIDKNSSYFRADIIKSAHRNSFKAIADDPHGAYDKNNYYYYGEKITLKEAEQKGYTKRK